MANLFNEAIFSAFDNNADPGSGWKLNFYITGTTTPKDSFTDNALSVAHANPVVADSAGRFAAIYLEAGDYKVVLTDASDVVIWTIDPVHGSDETGDTLSVTADGSTTARDLSARFADPANVLDYGAVGNGSTDDTTAVAAAITTGRDVYFPPGLTFLVTGLTILTARQLLFGRGAIRLANGTDKSVITVSANGVVIRDVEIDGNKANQTTAVNADGSGIWVTTGIDELSVLNTTIRDCIRDGVGCFGNHEKFFIDGNLIKDVGFIAIQPSQASGAPHEHSVFSKNIITSPGQDGIGTVAIQHCTVKGNTIKNPVVAGIAFEALCSNSTIIGNTILGDAAEGPTGTTSGIQVNDAQQISITGNTVVGCGNGIIAAGNVLSRDVAIVGNTVEDCGYVTSAIGIETSTSNIEYGISCIGNIVRDSRRTGIFLTGISGATVSHNYINGVNLQNSTIHKELGGIILRNASNQNTVESNRVIQGTSGNLKIGIFTYEDGSGLVPGNNNILNNQISDADYDIITRSVPTAAFVETVVRTERLTAAPTTGSWNVGNTVDQVAPVAAGTMGWVTTTAGTFGAQATTGSIDSGSVLLTLASLVDFYPGMWITVAGAGPAAAALDARIDRINVGTAVAALSVAAGTTVAAAAVTTFNPTFKAFGTIAA